MSGLLKIEEGGEEEIWGREDTCLGIRLSVMIQARDQIESDQNETRPS